MDERRINRRQKTLKSAKIVFNNDCVIDCAVRNLSETGACLEVSSPLGIPNAFDLVIEQDSFARPCRVAWKTPKRLGVAFR